MTKSIKDYLDLDKWCDNHFIDESDAIAFNCYQADDVEIKLLEMQQRAEQLAQKDAEHKSEIKRLNNYIIKMQVDQIELIKKERARWQKEDLDALAKRDKQVKIDVLSKLCESTETHEVYFMSGSKHDYVLKLSDVEKYESEIKEQ